MSEFKLTELGGSGSAVVAVPFGEADSGGFNVTVIGGPYARFNLTELGGSAAAGIAVPLGEADTYGLDPTVSGGRSGARFNLTELGGSANPNAVAQFLLTELGGSATVTAIAARFNLTELGGSAAASLTAVLTATGSGDPGSVITLDASGSTGASTYTFQQLSGPTAALTQLGAFATITVPPLPTTGTAVFQVTTHQAGQADTTAQVTVTFWAVAEWFLDSDRTWRPRILQTI